MPESDQTEVLRQLSEVRRELRLVRGWLVFVSIAAGLFLFAPAVALSLAALVAQAFAFLTRYASAAVGVAVSVLLSAVIVSWRANRGRAEAASAAEDPAA